MPLTASEEQLLALAKKVRDNAYAPYSGFRVGAALLAADGKIYLGCNMENASFSATACAERNAFAAAVADGARRFTAIAVVGGKKNAPISFCLPCGVCRQVMQELCAPDFTVVTENADGERKRFSLASLLPHAFTL